MAIAPLAGVIVALPESIYAQADQWFLVTDRYWHNVYIGEKDRSWYRSAMTWLTLMEYILAISEHSTMTEHKFLSAHISGLRPAMDDKRIHEHRALNKELAGFINDGWELFDTQSVHRNESGFWLLFHLVRN